MESDIFLDDEDREPDWKPCVWWEIGQERLYAYTYMTPNAKAYYIPGLITQLLTGAEPGVEHEQMLHDLAEPDHTASEESYALWELLLNVSRDRFCAISAAIPLVERIVGVDLAMLSDAQDARRRARYWTGKGCHKTPTSGESQ